ncbi:DUF3574 domain-containing protein [Rhizomicrobium palustre]
MRCLALLFLASIVAGCAGVSESQCPLGERAMVKADIFFGRGMRDGGEVSEREWQNFADAEITPRFPDGFTLLEANGQWRGAEGIVREKSKHLIVVLPTAASEKLEAVRAAYKRRFHQEAVLQFETRGCASF